MEYSMDELFELIKDRYTPVELVEKLDISMDDLVYNLYSYLEDNLEIFSDELREFFTHND